MFKLMEFITGKKVAQAPVTNTPPNNNNNAGSAPNSPQVGRAAQSTPPPQPVVPVPEEELIKPKFTKTEKEEIRQTLTKFQGSEAHQILLKQLAEHELSNIVNENNESDSDDSDNNYGTFCIKDVKNNSSSSDDAYGTFCVKNVGDGDGENYGTMCISNFGDSNGGAPDFSSMFREPEEWEKYILALEKGEWVDGMAEKGAFKRWNKHRPAMPSAYLRESPISHMLPNHNKKNSGKKK